MSGAVGLFPPQPSLCMLTAQTLTGSVMLTVDTCHYRPIMIPEESMGVGHLAVALMLKRAEPRIKLGLLFFASVLSDFLLGVFYWLGFEHASIPAHYENAHSMSFSFPYSHGLVATLLWSAFVFLLARYLWRRGDNARIGIILALGSCHISFWISSFTYRSCRCLDQTLTNWDLAYGII
jgi:hypothetical protein